MFYFPFSRFIPVTLWVSMLGCVKYLASIFSFHPFMLFHIFILKVTPSSLLESYLSFQKIRLKCHCFCKAPPNIQGNGKQSIVFFFLPFFISFAFAKSALMPLYHTNEALGHGSIQPVT